MIGYIYKTTNKVTGKIYIGKRQKPKFQKWYYGSGTLLKPALKKYGKEAFRVEILEECESKEALNNAEKKWIRIMRESGANMYNISDGGDGGCLVKWWEFDAERKKEIIRKNSEAHKGKRNPMYGVHLSGKSRGEQLEGIPLPASHAQNIRDGKRKHLKPILQIDKETGEVLKKWNNWGEAGEQFREKHGRCAYGHISECCKGLRKSAYGYRWEFCESGWRL